MKALMVLLLLLGTAFANEELDRLISFALENNPGIRAFPNLKSSFEYKAKFLKSLPNPSLSISLNNLDTERYFPNKENPMSSFGLFLSQKYILPQKRSKSSEIFIQKGVEVLLMEEKFIKELIRDIKVLYWDFSYSYEMERIFLKTRKEIKDLIDITEEKFRYGEALLSDLILLKVELLKVDENISKALRLRETTLQRIYALAGGKIQLKGSQLKHPRFHLEFSHDRNVDVRLLKEQLKTIKREIERAKVEHYPDFLLGVGYAIRPDIPNLITLKFGLTLPVWKNKREDTLVLEAQERYNSQLFKIKDTELRVAGEFMALKESFRITSEILSTVEKEIGEKEKEIEALLIAYEYNRTDIREILRAYRILWSLELERAKLLRELNQIIAKAEALQ